MRVRSTTLFGWGSDFGIRGPIAYGVILRAADPQGLQEDR